MHCFERVRRWRHLASPKHSLLTLGSADQQIRRGSGCTRLQACTILPAVGVEKRLLPLVLLIE